MIDGGTLVAAAGVVVSILVPMAGLFLRLESRLTRLEAMAETALEVRAVYREESAWRMKPQAVKGAR